MEPSRTRRDHAVSRVAMQNNIPPISKNNSPYYIANRIMQSIINYKHEYTRSGARPRTRPPPPLPSSRQYCRAVSCLVRRSLSCSEGGSFRYLAASLSVTTALRRPPANCRPPIADICPPPLKILPAHPALRHPTAGDLATRRSVPFLSTCTPLPSVLGIRQ